MEKAASERRARNGRACDVGEIKIEAILLVPRFLGLESGCLGGGVSTACYIVLLPCRQSSGTAEPILLSFGQEGKTKVHFPKTKKVR